MKKKFIKPELYKVELRLKENIAASIDDPHWVDWITDTFLAWHVETSPGCNDFISGPTLGSKYVEPAAPYSAYYDEDFYRAYAVYLDNCRLSNIPTAEGVSVPITYAVSH